MRKRSWRISLCIMLIVAAAALVVDWRISSGFLLGCFVSVLLYLRTVAFCNAVLENGRTTKTFIFSRFMSSYALMAIPLLLAAVLPQYFNLFAAAAGLLLIKVTLIFDSLLERRGSDE